MPTIPSLLKSIIMKPVSPQDQVAINYISNMDLTRVERFLSQVYPYPKAVPMYEYRRFLILKIYHRDADGTLLSPSLFANQVWNTHVTDTRSLSPNYDLFEVENPITQERRQQNTLDAYASFFGEELTDTLNGGKDEKASVVSDTGKSDQWSPFRTPTVVDNSSPYDQSEYKATDAESEEEGKWDGEGGEWSAAVEDDGSCTGSRHANPSEFWGEA
ncbi:hypothetical protein HK097_003987 [Rhizophlyctis rosea]|uniref:Uncharacterized protein n=1 Tax=Rhizophlyctis rosea TaxID=64517 RepID=A0AAD5X3P2_9FUNG|nr:hypothetical protein HK097_003987 [Rhizophlyctis rosea]